MSEALVGVHSAHREAVRGSVIVALTKTLGMMSSRAVERDAWTGNAGPVARGQVVAVAACTAKPSGAWPHRRYIIDYTGREPRPEGGGREREKVR